MLIELQSYGQGKLSGIVNTEDARELGDLSLLMLDSVQAVRLNGHLLAGEAKNGSYHYAIPSTVWGDGVTKTLEIEHVDMLESNYIVFLQGRFAVRSESAYKEKADRQLATKGPFVITSTGRTHRL